MSFEHAMSVLNLDVVPSTEPDALASMDLAQLASLRSRIEAQIDTLHARLYAQNADMDTPLVSDDGFPRSDIDVVQIRLLRTQIIRLRNDWRLVSDALQPKLAQSFSRATTVSRPSSIPFASVAFVAQDSPAHTAGLRPGDLLLSFGRINATNHNNLKALVGAVAENVPVEVVVLRNNTPTQLTLVPAKWAGQGLLGCKLDVVS
ncbi:hypothetical protein HPODL_02229 [Ogataea parapolymorpha DL-1]|uniref:Probable 26S proteasome regulatory subunit p27 n=1 Tax=Ogataea parapolymorpha (strain ATCC 26012 / BCRC 20466 / JCM 22074 / NRRL Y-7560 / DL-1) TaxID=871575 RepID=W1QKT0_OGAPD|nr:hypothetical protein HPODL_02229 [Ogataea parapolymorpha DL-1]ESX02915.1 hypothetical protein HPODL_02229 [Ogataea parapolymorpha DL-1]